MSMPTRHDEHSLEATLMAVTSAVAIQGPTGANVYANAMAAHILGLSVDQLLGRTAADPLWQATRADGTALPPDEHPGPVVYRTGLPLRGMIMSVAGLDGRRWLEVDAEPLFMNGLVDRVVITYRDITARRQAEEALRASEALFRSIYEHAPIGVMLADTRGYYLATNPAMQHLVGYSEDELRRMSFDEVTHPDDRAAGHALFQELLAGERDSYTVDTRYVRKDGQIVWGELAVSVTRDPQGAPQSIIGMVLDISERKRTEATNGRLAAIVEASDDAIISTNLAGKIESWNGGAARLHGYSAEEVIGKHVSLLVPAERLGELRQHLDQLHQGVHIARYGTQRRARDGSLVDVSLTATPLRDRTGRIIGTSWITRDIRQQVQAQQAVEELARLRQEQSEEAEAMATVTTALSSTLETTELYALILEQAARVLPMDHASVLLIDGDSIMATATWGSPRLPLGEPLFPVSGPNRPWLPDLANGLVYLTDATREPAWCAMPYFTGTHRPRSVIAVPLRVEGSLLGWFQVCSFQPGFYAGRQLQLAASFGERVTVALRNARLYERERAVAAHLRRLEEWRTSFLHVMAHELRTPLGQVLGFSDLVTDEADRLTARGQRYMANVRQASRSLERLVERCLDVLDLFAVDVRLAAEPVNLVALANLALDAVRQAAQERGVSLHAELTEQEPIIQGDNRRLHQLISILLDNAVKFAPPDGRVEITTEHGETSTELAIWNDGPGVPDEVAEHIFRQGQVAEGLTRRHSGVGLSLLLARRIAELHGGSLCLDPSVTGARFVLALPVAASPPHGGRVQPPIGAPGAGGPAPA